MPKFTVVGLCEEQRHAFYVTARDAGAAERKCVKDHGSETSYHLFVAGVLNGFHEIVDSSDVGLDVQASRKKK